MADQTDETMGEGAQDFVLFSERRVRECLSGDRLQAFDSLRDRARHLWDEYQRQADRIEALEAALRPFAEIGLDPADTDEIGHGAAPVGCLIDLAEFTAGDVRRARVLLGEEVGRG